MSAVTNVLLFFSVLETVVDDEAPILEKVNEYLQAESHRPMTRLDYYAGGEKVFDSRLYGGAFRAFSKEDFVKHIFSLEWKSADDVIIIIQEEGDYMPGMMSRTSVIAKNPQERLYRDNVKIVRVE